LIQLVDDPSMAAWSPAGMSVVTSLKAGIVDLLSRATPPRRAVPEPMSRPARIEPGELSDAYLLQQIAKLRPASSIVVEEAPSSRAAMHDHLPIVAADTFYTCASGGLGYGLPAAVGVALGRPGEKIIAILGDGSSMYAIQGLWSAAQREVPIAFVIIRNGGYEALHEFREHFSVDQIPGSRLPGLDFCGLARAQGVSATRVTRCDELDAALIEAFASRSPMLVEVVVV
jgi:benzoylformate decarboxylase